MPLHEAQVGWGPNASPGVEAQGSRDSLGTVIAHWDLGSIALGGSP